ncbi:MAG: PDZ domain-containing protein [Clostridia bacterium]|nr:PDZ domain-containing protein [Clostridia bacterium]
MKLSLSTAILLVAVAVFITYQATYTALEKRHSETVYTLTDTKSSYTKLNSVDEIVRNTYINEIDEEALENGLIHGYLYGLGDKYASYLTEEEYENYANQHGKSRVGLGISVTYDASLDGLYVNTVYPDTPAMTSGLCEGDIIYAVDGKTIEDRGYYETINHITGGKPGDTVSVLVKRAPDYNEYTEIVLYRDIIKNSTLEYSMYGEDTGYVKISAFNTTTFDEFKTAMDDLQAQGAVRYVFDVRSNLGGELGSISKVLDYLLPEGPIIRIFSKTDGETVISSDAECLDAPMAVLINGSTASAAELFASALRDYNKAMLVGKTTFGKGTVQTMHRLSGEIGGGAISISTGMYNPPISDNYEGKGIAPDIEVDIPEEIRATLYRLPLESDPQFVAALRTLGVEVVQTQE